MTSKPTTPEIAFVGAAMIPGMPHLLATHPADSWARLARETQRVGEELLEEEPDAIVALSTQWFTVLGHQLQMDPRPCGTRIDENWYAYDYGELSYEFDIDVELTERWAQKIENEGYQARRTRYEGFPVDTGSIVGHKLLNQTSIPTALVSCNLYAKAEDLGSIANCALRAGSELGRRVAFIAISGLSSGLIQRWIEPEEDDIERPAYERWDRHILDLLSRDRLAEVLRLREEYAREAAVDSQLRALSFLSGTGCLRGPADVRTYGPVWGTGAAVIHWPPRRINE